MLRRAVVVLVGVAVVLIVTAPARAQTPVTVGDLVADPEAYSEVTVVGELVGDYGERCDGQVWAQLNGDAYATSPLLDGGELAGANVGIGVRLPADLMVELDGPGGYRLRGPLVRVTGEWRYHDSRRGGETYLQATGLAVVEPGRSLDESVSWPALAGGVVLLAAAAWLYARERWGSGAG